MPYLKVIPQYSLGNVPVVLKPAPVYGAYVRGSVPWSFQRRLRAVKTAPLFTSPVYSQYRAPRGRTLTRAVLPSSMHGFGVEVQASFLSYTDLGERISRFIAGVQRGLLVEMTGKWDKATHAAFAAYLGTLGGKPLGAWGEKPAATANAVALLLIGLALPGTWLSPNVRAADFAAGWGIPATNAGAMGAWIEANKAALEEVLPSAIEQIVVAETGRCSSWLMTGLIGAGALVVGAGVGYAVGRRK